MTLPGCQPLPPRFPQFRPAPSALLPPLRPSPSQGKDGASPLPDSGSADISRRQANRTSDPPGTIDPAEYFDHKRHAVMLSVRYSVGFARPPCQLSSSPDGPGHHSWLPCLHCVGLALLLQADYNGSLDQDTYHWRKLSPASLFVHSCFPADRFLNRASCRISLASLQSPILSRRRDW